MATEEPQSHVNKEETLLKDVSGSLADKLHRGQYSKGIRKARHLAL
jgi:hypothetical protein